MRALALGISVLTLSAAGLVLAPTAAAQAPVCVSSGVDRDLDNDGYADLVVGASYLGGPVGRVEIAYRDGDRQVITRDALLPTFDGDLSFFGAAVAVADVNRDGCQDLLVSAPSDNGIDPEDDDDGGGDPGRPGVPRLFIIPGSPSGPKPAQAQAITLPDSGQSLAVLTNRDAAGNPQVQLVVGMPYADPGGAIAVFLFDAQGRPGSPTVITQDSPGVAGVSEDNDSWGDALATTGRTIVVGAPNEKTGTADRTGAITLLTARAAQPQSFTGQGYSQASAGVPGTTQFEDEFGASISASGSDIAVGVPGDYSGGAIHSGAVNLFRWNETTATLTPGALLHQGSTGIPGSNEAYDRFGDSVLLGRGIKTVGRTTLVIASSNENAGSVDDAGAWTMLDLGTTQAARYDLASSGVPGTPGRNGGAFIQLSLLAGPQKSSATRRDAVAVGLPSMNPAGRVVAGPTWRSSGWVSVYPSNTSTGIGDFGAGLPR